MSATILAVLGTAIDTPQLGGIRIRENALFLVAAQGLIETVLLPGEAGYEPALAKNRLERTLVELGTSEYLLPGFIVLHRNNIRNARIGGRLVKGSS